MAEVLVEFDYSATESDELTIKKGDIIREVIKKPGGWWEGTLNNKKGLFPDNFVKPINKESVTLRNKKDASRIRQCRVVFSYRQEHPDELSLNIGDNIDILGEEEEGWWRGVLNGQEGVFPSNFVEEIKSKPGSREDLTYSNDSDAKGPSLPPKPAKTLCQVKFSYKAQNDDELSLKEGDVITLISKDGQDFGWWKGELNGRIGVFPDNFVVVLGEGEDKHQKDDRKNAKPQDPSAMKPPVTSAQRKSLEEKHDKTETDAGARVTPPVPSKKPLIPMKKSPSSSGSQGSLLAGLRKKIVDVVDGASNSKSQPVLVKATEIKDDIKAEDGSENAFDQVERTSMLSDVRATRAKAPGRRPPSVVFKEGEPGVVNGNTDHVPLENLTEHLANSRTSTSSNEQENDTKPKVREWEKHKAPWLEEMKLNQAKRTSTSPGPEQNKLKLTPSDKGVSPENDELKTSKISPPIISNPVDMSKSMSAVNNKLITPPNELEISGVVMGIKPNPIPSQPTARPQSIHSSVTPINDSHSPKQFGVQTHSSASAKTPPSTNHVQINLKISPSPKPGMVEKPVEIKPTNENAQEGISTRQYLDLLQRIEKLEILISQQQYTYNAAIEELKGKLQVETDMRRLLQAELEKISCVMQV